jgi:hypothetical protein
MWSIAKGDGTKHMDIYFSYFAYNQIPCDPHYITII